MNLGRVFLGSASLALLAGGVLVQACGGDDNVAPTKDASTDSTFDTGAGDAAEDGGGDAAPDSGPPSCAPPSDPTKSALCVRVTPESIHFLTDPSFDGKGIMLVDIHDAPNPDAPDGAPLPALQAVLLPSNDAGTDAGELDLSAALPVVRFDGLPQAVYPRVVFVDSRVQPKPTAGWWIGGYDLANGFGNPSLLKPVTLVAGQATTITIDLLALRALVVTLTLGTTPAGNAMGPAVFAVMTDLAPNPAAKTFGFGASVCANLNDASTARAAGYVVGKGPYYTFAQLDDFGEGGILSPGALTTLAPGDGGFQNPPGSQLAYVPGSYVITQSLTLDLTVPRSDAGVDTVSCP